MKNIIVAKYEKEKWYRAIKSLYIFFFAATMLVANFIAFATSAGFWSFVITNAVVIFSFGTVEGLFWYIVRGKWGYPKDDESTE